MFQCPSFNRAILTKSLVKSQGVTFISCFSNTEIGIIDMIETVQRS